MTKSGEFILVNVQGLASAGTVRAPGLKVGDRIIHATSKSILGNVNIFEAVVSANDEIKQFTSFPNPTTAVEFQLLAIRLS